MSKEKVKSVRVENDIDKVWNGIYNEIDLYKKKTLGKILTIIDAVIVDEKQNKSVKDIITKSIWENDNAEKMTREWLKWLDENNNITVRSDVRSSEPMLYERRSVPSLKHYNN